MRTFLLYILFSFIFLSGKAKTIVNGYVITLKQDTMKCKISVDGLDLFTSVTIFDTTGNKTTYKAKHREIAGFGFTYKNQPYDYVLKVNEDSTWLFQIRMIQGRPYNLYYSFAFNLGYPGLYNYRTNSYMIEDSANRVVSWDGIFTDHFKKRMRQFLYNDQKLIDLYNRIVNRLADIPAFVKAVNELDR
jgi:hypothetical protein